MSAAIEFPVERLTDTAIDIAKRRKEKLCRVKLAIRARDWDLADQLITELVPDDKKGHTITARFDRRAGRRK